ncbi:alpha/beta fold hydrolase [uncultured Sphingomonas sp.]|uniref:S9 family peptidase n=1 Tax=uncultured Sphingomonas sp. TaxID=158754 RepID=UPI0035CBFA68
MRGWLGAIGAAFLASQASAAAPGDDSAALFGAREQVVQASLSPDGKMVAFVAAGSGRTTELWTGTVDAALKTVMRTSGSPDRLERCQWSTDTRLVCSLLIMVDQPDGVSTFTRMVTLNADGTDLKVLSARPSSTALEPVYDGGGIVDWLGDDGGGKVLMTREFVTEYSTGTLLANQRRGLGLEQVNTTSLARTTVEQPTPSVVEYITDGHGAVRVRGLRVVNGGGYVANVVGYQYRTARSRDWQPLSNVSVVTGAGFDPYAVDRQLDVAYGFDWLDGRRALFKAALDGSGKREVVLSRPDVDVDGLVRIGRQHRVVGASFATDKRQVEFFDPALKALSAKLAKALPGLPLVDFVDASDDETKLLLWAGSDDDPGRYFIYDKTSRHLGMLLDVRPELAKMTLSPVTAITYPAADGTLIPAYLTLPPGSDGKHLPAIVLPHGGPASRDEWGFDWLSQYFAQRGFAVLQPNYRGSAGFGSAWFEKNGFQSWRIAIGDVTDGGRWLVKTGIARADQLAIVGWSYGGYAALQSAVLDPALFKAVVAVAPVTDLALLKTEARNYSNAPEVDAFVGAGPHLHEGSPAQNAGAIRAPVLLFHGNLDQNVAISQSRLMQSRLKAAGATSQLIEFKGLDHQLEDSQVRAAMLSKADAFLRASMGM